MCPPADKPVLQLCFNTLQTLLILSQSSSVLCSIGVANSPPSGTEPSLLIVHPSPRSNLSINSCCFFIPPFWYSISIPKVSSSLALILGRYCN